MRPRAVVVGAGTAGSVLAARIADRYDVVVVEAGRRERPLGTVPPRGVESLAHPLTWSLPARLTGARTWKATPGRAVGGSSVINGGYFAAPEASDLDRWRTAGGPPWSPSSVLSRIAESSERLGVQPAPSTHPIARAFADAAQAMGHESGLLRLHTTFSGGLPRNVADAYLADTLRPVEVRADCRALRVVVQHGRATGVEVADGGGGREMLTADEVILCSGGFGSARLLFSSGIGPAERLREAGIDPVADIVGIGAAFSDHPTVWVEWMPSSELAARTTADAPYGAFPLALRMDADGAAGDDLEILACILPPEIRTGDRDATDPFGLLVGLQRPLSRGTVVPASAHPLAAPRIDYDYLADGRDREALRTGVRRAAEMIASPAFSDLARGFVDLHDDALGDDVRLDAWIAERLGSAAHTCGTAPMGAADDPRAVVDGAGCVRGIAGLRVADTSILPSVPSRGPAAAALAIGAIIADQMP